MTRDKCGICGRDLMGLEDEWGGCVYASGKGTGFVEGGLLMGERITKLKSGECDVMIGMGYMYV